MKTNVSIRLLGAALCITGSVAFAGPGKNDPKTEKIKFIDKANMDMCIKPGDNFYHVCKW